MDDEHVDHEFFNLAMGDYADSIEKFIEHTRVVQHHLRVAIQDEDTDQVVNLSQNRVHAVSGVQVGNIHNLIAGYASSLNEERSAGLLVYGVLMHAIDEIVKLHAHLVRVNQPNQELLMVTDLLNDLRSRADRTPYGQMAKEFGK